MNSSISTSTTIDHYDEVAEQCYTVNVHEVV